MILTSSYLRTEPRGWNFRSVYTYFEVSVVFLSLIVRTWIIVHLARALCWRWWSLVTVLEQFCLSDLLLAVVTCVFLHSSRLHFGWSCRCGTPLILTMIMVFRCVWQCYWTRWCRSGTLLRTPWTNSWYLLHRHAISILIAQNWNCPFSAMPRTWKQCADSR